MTTNEAFGCYLADAALIEKSLIQSSHLRVLRKQWRDGVIGEKAMTKWLTAAGFSVQTEWTIPVTEEVK